LTAHLPPLHFRRRGELRDHEIGDRFLELAEQLLMLRFIGLKSLRFEIDCQPALNLSDSRCRWLCWQ
jgi:hypothetical protein